VSKQIPEFALAVTIVKISYWLYLHSPGGNSAVKHSVYIINKQTNIYGAAFKGYNRMVKLRYLVNMKYSAINNQFGYMMLPSSLRRQKFSTALKAFL
jgi:hypothetical protein